MSFFTRDQGKLRGVARAVRRPKSRFGSGLERLSHVRLAYFLRENQDLARLDRSELCGPPIFLRADYATSVALDFLAEVSEQVLPEHEPNDAHFRLLLLVIDDIREGLKQAAPKQTASSRVDALAQVARAGGSSGETGTVAVAERPLAGVSETPGWLWRAVTYFSLWSLRLGGWLPPLGVCIRGGVEFEPQETVYFSRSHPGLFSADYRDRDCWAMSPESRRIAGEMLKKPLPRLDERVWSRDTAEDLRRFLVQRLEAQIEHRLKTAAVLAEL